MIEGKLYPSEQRRLTPQVIHPSRAQTFSAGDQERRALHVLRMWCHNRGIDSMEGLNKQQMLEGLTDGDFMNRRDAWQMVKRLWRCQLVQRVGVINTRSGRPQNQRWIF